MPGDNHAADRILLVPGAIGWPHNDQVRGAGKFQHGECSSVLQYFVLQNLWFRENTRKITANLGKDCLVQLGVGAFLERGLQAGRPPSIDKVNASGAVRKCDLEEV